MKTIKCTQCGFNIPFSEKGNIPLVFCPNCDFSFMPNEYENLVAENFVWRSPISGSHGFVSFVDDGENKFYGCSETGAIWYDQENFFKEINNIIKKYPHRKKFYIKNGNKWIPSDVDIDMDELIDLEEKESLHNFVRG